MKKRINISLVNDKDHQALRQLRKILEDKDNATIDEDKRLSLAEVVSEALRIALIYA